MKDKIVNILSSVRFWQVLLIGLFEALVVVGAINSDTYESLVRIAQAILGSSVVIGTLDSIATKIKK